MEAYISVCLFAVLLIAFIWKKRKARSHHTSDVARPASTDRARSNSAKQAVPNEKSASLAVKTPKYISGNAFVVDGDSLVIKKKQIRVFGIDAPELKHPYGKQAKWALVKLCKGQTVKAEILSTDDYGRIVAKCFLPDGRDLSAEMVKLGMAIDWPKFSEGLYTELEPPGIRKKLWLVDARQKGRMDVWDKFEERQKQQS